MNFYDLNEYDFWANTQILNILLKHKDLKEASDFFHHILEANLVWYSRIVQQEINADVWAETYDIDNFQRRSEENYTNFKSYLESNSSEQLENSIHYRTLKGDPYTNKISDILFHVFNHSTHHRAQIMSLWKEREIKRPSLDYIFYQRNKVKY